MTALRVTDILEPGQWRGAADHVTLDYDGRHRRRIVLTTDHGVEVLLDLEQTRLLPHGAGLKLEDGRIVAVIAQVEPLLEVRAQDASGLLRLAWHIGNRHLTAQVEPHRILIRRDHVIADMLTGLGATVRPVEEQFDPEGGAYGGLQDNHDHSHSGGHSHES